MKIFKTVFLILIIVSCFIHVSKAQTTSQYRESFITVNIDTNTLYGTLTMPISKKACPIMLLIAGSGPTNRDGNQPNLESNAYKQLAEALAAKGIATLRYDKRGVGESSIQMKESDLRFDQFIDDAIVWIQHLKKDQQFSKVIVAGHSEGSLIGMAACTKTNADAYISLAGAGRSIDEILKKQLKTAIPDSAYYAKSCHYLDTLKQGQLLTDADPALATLFRESIQPYMISWIKYNPSEIIAMLKIPIFIIQGETDIQVEVENAYQLAEANEKAGIKIINGMNHVLKQAELDRTKNFATYSDPNLPVVTELINEIASFVLRK